MARLVVKRLAPKKTAPKKQSVKKVALKKVAAKKSASSVTSKSIRTADGQRFKVWSIDANSPSFGDDLSTVFARHVSKARKENLERFGSADRVASKAR